MFGVRFSSSTNSSNWPPELAASTVSPSNSSEPIERQWKVATQPEKCVALRTMVRTYTQTMEGLKTAQLANEGGVNVETIRYYERHGLLAKPPRTPSGYRVFSEDAISRLRFIKRSQDLGFSLKEVKELLALRVRPGSGCA